MDKKTLSRRDFIKAAGLAAGASLLAACTRPTAEVAQTPVVQETENVNQVVTATPAPTKVPAPVVMDIWAIPTVEDINAEWKAEPTNEAFQKEWLWGGLIRLQARAFLAKHPGVTVKVTGHGWDWELRQNQYKALAAGTIPDTMYGEGYVGEFVQMGLYNPVSAEAQALFPESTYRAATMDGKAYGLPESAGANVLFVNVARLEQAGLDPGKLPTIWDELVTMAQAVSDAGNGNAFFTYAPLGQGYGIPLRLSAWFEQNHTPLGSDQGVPSFNAPGAADVWVFHNQLMHTSKVDKILEISNEGDPLAAIADGTIAFHIGWSGDASGASQNPDANVIAIELPIPPGGKRVANLVDTQLNSPLKNGPNPDLAVDYIELSTTNQEAQEFMPNSVGWWSIPALKSILENYQTYDKLGAYPTDKAKELVRVTMKAALTGCPIPGWPKNSADIWTAWNEMYDRIWKGNLSKADIQKELDALQIKVEDLINKPSS